MNCIYLLWLRQVKRFSRPRARIFASLAQPLLLLFLLGFGVEPIYQKAGRESYIQFLSAGVVGMILLFTSVLSGLWTCLGSPVWFFKRNFGSSGTANTA